MSGLLLTSVDGMRSMSLRMGRDMDGVFEETHELIVLRRYPTLRIARTAEASFI